MADINLDDLTRAISEGMKDVTKESFKKSADDLFQLGKENLKKSDELRRQLFEKQKEAVKNLTNSAVTFGKSLENASNSNAILQSTVTLAGKAVGSLVGKLPVLGGALAGLSEAAATASNMLIDTFTRFYSEYEKLATSGVVTTTEDFKDAMKSTGMTMSDVSRVLGKYSKEMSYFGGTALEGRERFQELSADSINLKKEFQRLGINASDFSEYQLSYLNRLQRTGKIQQGIDGQLIAGTQEYILRLDTLSKITGKNKDAIQTELDERLRDARYRAGIATLDGKARNNIDDLITFLSGKAPDIASALQDTLGGLAPNTDKMKAFRTAFGAIGDMNIENFISGMRSGEISLEQSVSLIKKAAGNYKKMEELTRALGPDNPLTALFPQLKDLAEIVVPTKELQDKLRKDQEDAKKGRKEQNTALADTKFSMYKLQGTVEDLFTDMKFATTVMQNFSEGLLFAAEKVGAITGNKLPEHLKASLDRSKVMAEHQRLRSNVETAAEKAQTAPARSGKNMEPSKEQKELTNARRELSEYEKETGRPYTVKELEALDLKVKPGAQIDEAPLSSKLIEVAQEIKKLPGFERFSSLNDNYHAGQTSKHAKGLALDFTLNGLRGIMPEHFSDDQRRQIAEIENKLRSIPGISKILNEYLKPSGKATGGHFHIEVPGYDKGGIVDSPTLAMIGETRSEAVIPLSDNRTVPVSLNAEVFKSMNSKLEELISLMRKSNSIQDSLYRQLA